MGRESDYRESCYSEDDTDVESFPFAAQMFLKLVRISGKLCLFSWTV